MNRNQTAQTMTDDAKVAAVQQLAVQQKDEQLKKDLAALIEKYGPYAYDIVKIVQSSEAEAKLKQINFNEKMTAKEAISRFANQDVSTADLAKLFNQDELKIDANIAHYKETLISRTPQTEDLSAQQQKLEQKINDREPEANVIETVSKEQQQDSKTTQTDTPSLETVIQQAELKPMTLDEYVKYYKPEDKPLTEDELREAAYKDFAKGEGHSQRIYVEQPNKGNPTIGTGNLILPEQLLDPNVKNKAKYGSLSAYKTRFQQMKLYKKSGSKNVPLTAQEKGKIFDDLVTAIKKKTLKTKNVNGVNVIVSPASAANVIMNEDGMKAQFNKDFNAQLDKLYKGLGKGNKEKGKEIYSKYPQDLQLSLLHTYYAGTPGRNISKAIADGKINPENPVEVLTKIAQERTVGTDEALKMLQKMNPEAFSDAKIAEYKRKYNRNRRKSNSPNAPKVDALQMGAAADSLRLANDARRQAEMMHAIPMQTVPVYSSTTPKSNEPKIRMAMITRKLGNQK